MSSQNGVIAASRINSVHNEEQARLDQKLRRELGEVVLTALADPRTEDIVLNPDSQIWVKRQGEGFRAVGNMASSQARAKIRLSTKG